MSKLKAGTGAAAPVAPRLKRWATLAREAGIPYNTLRDAALRGQIPVVKIGEAWYGEQADVDAFIASRKSLLA